MDSIQKFKLTQDEQLKIEQEIPYLTGKNEKYKNPTKEIEIPDRTGTKTQKSELSDKKINKYQEIETKLINFNEHVNENNFKISINCIDHYEKSMM